MGARDVVERERGDLGRDEPAFAAPGKKLIHRFVQHIADLTPPESLPEAKAEDLLGQGKEDELLEEVYARYTHAAKDASIVVVEGLVPRRGEAFLTNLNVKIAQTLDADTILVTAPVEPGREKTIVCRISPAVALDWMVEAPISS